MTKFSVAGQQLLCQICNHDHFSMRRAQLNTRMAELFNIAWANESAVCLVCENCGYIHWFFSKGLIQEQP
jgi:hypothetical protein